MRKNLRKRIETSLLTIIIGGLLFYGLYKIESPAKTARQEGRQEVINYLRGMGPEKDFYQITDNGDSAYVPVGSIVSSVGEELDNHSNLDSLLSSHQKPYNSN